MTRCPPPPEWHETGEEVELNAHACSMRAYMLAYMFSVVLNSDACADTLCAGSAVHHPVRSSLATHLRLIRADARYPHHHLATHLRLNLQLTCDSKFGAIRWFVRERLLGIPGAGGGLDISGAGGDFAISGAGGDFDISGAGGDFEISGAGGDFDISGAGRGFDICRSGGVGGALRCCKAYSTLIMCWGIHSSTFDPSASQHPVSISPGCALPPGDQPCCIASSGVQRGAVSIPHFVPRGHSAITCFTILNTTIHS